MHHGDQSCACTALRKASRAVSRLYDEALDEAGMTTTQFAILRTLSRAGAMPLSRLADRLVMDRTSLYRTLAPVTRHGWVRIEAGAGKAKLAVVTPEGAAAMTAAIPRWQQAQTRIVGALGPAGWETLESALTDVTLLAGGAA